MNPSSSSPFRSTHSTSPMSTQTTKHFTPSSNYQIQITQTKATILFLLFIFPFLVIAGPPPPPSPPPPLHIFISFRGADTRESIASLFYDALHRAGFNVFMDDQSIRTGHNIDSVIREAINNSMGAIVIFSKNFASSEWCLEELVLILDRKRELGPGYVLQPIYVDGIDPDDIYEERGCYGDALAKHKKRYSYWNWNWNQKWNWDKKVNLWSASLREVADYKGKILTGKWAMFINDMVEDIRQEFIILGIIVKPRPQCNTKSTGPMQTMFELIEKLIVLGRFLHQNKWILDVFMRHSFIQVKQYWYVFVQPHTQIQTSKSNEKNYNEMGDFGSEILFIIGLTMIIFSATTRNEMGVFGNEIVFVIGSTMVIISAFNLIRRKIRGPMMHDADSKIAK